MAESAQRDESAETKEEDPVKKLEALVARTTGATLSENNLVRGITYNNVVTTNSTDSCKFRQNIAYPSLTSPVVLLTPVWEPCLAVNWRNKQPQRGCYTTQPTQSPTQASPTLTQRNQRCTPTPTQPTVCPHADPTQPKRIALNDRAI